MEVDRVLFVKHVKDGDNIVAASNIVSVLVDDLISAAFPDAQGGHTSLTRVTDPASTTSHQTGPLSMHLCYSALPIIIQQALSPDLYSGGQRNVLPSARCVPTSYSTKPEASPLSESKHS